MAERQWQELARFARCNPNKKLLARQPYGRQRHTRYVLFDCGKSSRPSTQTTLILQAVRVRVSKLFPTGIAAATIGHFIRMSLSWWAGRLKRADER